MREFGLVQLCLSFMLGAFACWGILTSDGRRAFDEMAGMLPYAAGLPSLIVAVTGGLCMWWSQMRARKLKEGRSDK